MGPFMQWPPLHRQAEFGPKSIGSEQKQGTTDCSNPVPNPPSGIGRVRTEHRLSKKIPADLTVAGEWTRTGEVGVAIFPSGWCGPCSQV